MSRPFRISVDHRYRSSDRFGDRAGLCGCSEDADTRMLWSPAITEGKIAFVYADDIWVAGPDGSNPRRVTSHPGAEQNPYFSPDGRHIAFTASYDGNVDVYVIPTEGGEPTRLTWHPGEDIVRGFTPAGKVLFSSQRQVFLRRHSQFFVVDMNGGVPERLPVPTGDKGAISPDGKYLAYTPLCEVFRQWKNYRGGTASRIWVLKLDDLSHEEIPKPAGGCNDTEPMWIGETVYFLSDRDGEFNLYSYDRDAKTVDAMHRSRRLPDRQRLGRRRQTHLRAGRLDPPSSTPASASRTGSRSAWPPTWPRPGRALPAMPNTSGTLGISPSGQRAVLDYRGEIVTVPAKKGDPHNLTQTPGVHERSPAWSPDGKSIAYFSDATGEYPLDRPPPGRQGRRPVLPAQGVRLLRAAGVVARQQEDRLHRQLPHPLLDRPGHAAAVKRVAAEPIYGPRRTSRTKYAWSPDSKWLAYSLTNRAGFQAVWLYSARQGQVATPSPTALPRPASRSSTSAASTSTSWPRPTPAPSTTGSTSRSPTCRRPHRSTWSRSPRRRPTRSSKRATRKGPRSRRRSPTFQERQDRRDER